MRVLIGGGTGFIGTRLTYLLQHKGHDVIHVSRQAGAGRITWNELDRRGLPEDCSAIVNLAGQTLMDPSKRWNEHFEEDLRTSRINTTRSLVQAICKAKIKPSVFVSASAVGYYKSSPTAKYTEDSHGGDFDFLSILCNDWEQAAQLPSNINVRHVTVRIGLALGREGGAIQYLFIPFYLGLGGNVSTGKQWFPWIHVNDVAGIFTHAIENDHVTGVLNAVSPEAATNAKFTSALARAMWRPAIFPLPAFVVKAVFGPERAKTMLEGQHVIPKRTLESGYKFLYPDLKSACKEVAHLMPSPEYFKMD